MADIVAAAPDWFVLMAFLELETMEEFQFTKHPVIAWQIEEYADGQGFGGAPITIGDVWRRVTRERKPGEMCPYFGGILMPDGQVLEGSNAYEDDEFGDYYATEADWIEDARTKALRYSCACAIGQVSRCLFAAHKADIANARADGGTNQ